jgi:hypothetical protein
MQEEHRDGLLFSSLLFSSNQYRYIHKAIMRASASACICRLAQPARLVQNSQTVQQRQAQAASTSATSTQGLLFSPSSSSSSSSWQSNSNHRAASTTQTRGFTSTRADKDAAAEGEEASAAPASKTSLTSQGMEAWLKSQDGQKYKRPVVGRTNWIGRTVSFSFYAVRSNNLTRPGLNHYHYFANLPTFLRA